MQLPWDWQTATLETFDHWWISYVSGSHLFRDSQILQRCRQYSAVFSIMYIFSIRYYWQHLVVDNTYEAILQQSAKKLHWSTTPQLAISSTSHTSTSPQTWSQTLTQPLSEKTSSSTLTQTLQITSHFHYTSAYRTPSHPPTTPTRSTASTPYKHITRHLLRHSTTSLSAPLQTNDHLEAQSPHSTINHTQIATTTLSSTTGTIHP